MDLVWEREIIKRSKDKLAEARAILSTIQPSPKTVDRITQNTALERILDLEDELFKLLRKMGVD